MQKQKRQLAKVLEGNVTVHKILDNEELKDIADEIISEDVDNIILIYRNTKDKSIHYATTVKEWATVFGSMDMIHALMLDEWENQRYGCEEDEE